MANLNKVMLIGRLTRDPEVRTFSNGGKVAKIGFAVNNSKRNQQTGEWEDEPVFVDIDAFNRQEGRKLADLVEQYLRKGHQAYIEGRLQLDQWTDKDGQKRSKLKIVLDNLQLLEPKAADQGTGEYASRSTRAPAAPAQQRRAAPTAPPSNYDEPSHEETEPEPEQGEDSHIPF